MKNNNVLMNMVKDLSPAEQKNLVNELLSLLGNPSSDGVEANGCNDLVKKHNGERPDCPHCHAKAKLGSVVKQGFNKDVQRFRCKVCGKVFVSTTNTAFERSRKDANTWRQFIGMTINGKSLKECAAECSIAYQTAFTWRHKILNVFKVNQEATMMTGRVEIDEMQFPISYKGNRVKGAIGTRRILTPGADNGLPRKSFHRGSDNKSMSSRERACVFCMIEDGNKSFYAAVPGVGFMLPPMLDQTLAKHVKKETALILADNYRATKKYLEDNGYQYMTLLSKTPNNSNSHKPEIQGENHLQHINAMHGQIRRFLKPFYGVSTKYLENYISLYIWIRTNKALKQERKIDNLSITRAASADCYISRQCLNSLPAVPMCA